jgi:hypothetical protein
MQCIHQHQQHPIFYLVLYYTHREKTPLNGTVLNGTVYTLLLKRPIKCNLEMSGETGNE